MTCSRDKDLYILRAGRGANESNQGLRGGQLKLDGTRLDELKDTKKVHVPYNHWEKWTSYKPFRGYIHFGITDKLTSDVRRELIKKVNDVERLSTEYFDRNFSWWKERYKMDHGGDEMPISMMKEILCYKHYQLKTFFEMSEKIGSNVLVIEPHQEAYGHWKCSIHLVSKDRCCIKAKELSYNRKMASHFVFIGKTTSNLKNEKVNFGEYDGYGNSEIPIDVEIEEKKIGDLGNHSNYVELEGHKFKNPVSTSNGEYEYYFGKRWDYDLKQWIHPINWHNKRFSCYQMKKERIARDSQGINYWGKLDTLYKQ